MNRYLYFENLNEFFDYSFAESYSGIKLSRSEQKADWYGSADWQEAKNLALMGWPEFGNDIEQYKVEIIPLIADKVLRPLPTYAMAGFSVDVGLYLSNSPECFFSKILEERNAPGRIFKIVCSLSLSSKISPEIIKQRGAIICAMIEAIEYAGHRVELVCNWAVSKKDEDWYRAGMYKDTGWMEIDIMVKSSSQHLEQNRAAFVLSHPSMLRRLIFSCAEKIGWADFTGNYGYPGEASSKGDIYLREIFSRRISNEEAISWILKELKQIGVDISQS